MTPCDVVVSVNKRLGAQCRRRKDGSKPKLKKLVFGEWWIAPDKSSAAYWIWRGTIFMHTANTIDGAVHFIADRGGRPSGNFKLEVE